MSLATQYLLARLAKRYASAYGWAFLAEVGNATGYGTCRHADAMAIGIWPSRGLQFIGFEVKAHRGDWLRELKDPEKADEIARYCDRWYVVAASDVVVLREELPPLWGLMVPDKRGLKEIVSAPPMTPDPITREFTCAILRRFADGMTPKATIAGQIEQARKQGLDEARQDSRVQALTEALEKRDARIREFEANVGCPLDSWDHGRVDAIAAVMHNRESRQECTAVIQQALATATHQATLLKMALDQITQIPGAST
jgi:hypothetical protein